MKLQEYLQIGITSKYFKADCENIKIFKSLGDISLQDGLNYGFDNDIFTPTVAGDILVFSQKYINEDMVQRLVDIIATDSLESMNGYLKIRELTEIQESTLLQKAVEANRYTQEELIGYRYKMFDNITLT